MVIKLAIMLVGKKETAKGYYGNVISQEYTKHLFIMVKDFLLQHTDNIKLMLLIDR